MEDQYNSSEEIQRANRGTFVDPNAKKEAEEKRSEKDEIHEVLDKYIAEHGSTIHLKKLTEESGKSVEHQLDVSASLVEILEKIKKDLR